MEKWKKRAVDLLITLALGRGDPTVIPYHPQKTRISAPEERYFKRSTPEKHGISSKRLYNMLCELEAERHANIHNLMVICGGEVICECFAEGYGTNLWHISHSMAKTVCGMVVGTLIDEGRISIDDRLISIFPEIEYRDKKFPMITVDHLLSMTCGVDFAETGAVTEEKWTEAFFSAAVKFTPGSRFAYNSMNTYILAKICERISGESFISLARERIFEPLGIENYLWETSPEGTVKAGWGLYMSAESWARLGVMMLRGGAFNGKRILSEEWIRQSSSLKAVSPDFNGNFNYAYQMWISRFGDEPLFNGMLGQNVWICPQNDIVVVMQGGNNELFQASPSLEIIRKYLGGGLYDELNRRDIRCLNAKERTFFNNRRRVRPREKGGGFLVWLGIKNNTSFDVEWNKIIGSYALTENNIGILPLLVRVMQNNLNSRLKAISLEREGEGLYLSFVETDEKIRIPIGIYGYESAVIGIRGEVYLVRAMGEVVRDISGENEYRIRIILPETASERMILIKRIDDNKISVSLSETPNDRVVDNFLARYSQTSSSVGLFLDLLEKRLGEGVLTNLINQRFNPTVIGVSLSSPEWKKILDGENERAEAEKSKIKNIRALADKIFKESDNAVAGKNDESMETTVKKTLTCVLNKIRDKVRNMTENDN